MPCSIYNLYYTIQYQISYVNDNMQYKFRCVFSPSFSSSSKVSNVYVLWFIEHLINRHVSQPIFKENKEINFAVMHKNKIEVLR